MFLLRHRTLIFLSGLLWLAIGIFLLTLGCFFIIEACNAFPGLASKKFSFIKHLAKIMKDPQNISVAILSFALFLGYLKGKYVFSKTVNRQVKRITAFPNPTSLKNIYSKGYYLLIASMIGLGVCMRYLPCELDVRGLIDAAVGMALIQGAIQYFRIALTSAWN